MRKTIFCSGKVRKKLRRDFCFLKDLRGDALWRARCGVGERRCFLWADGTCATTRSPAVLFKLDLRTGFGTAVFVTGRSDLWGRRRGAADCLLRRGRRLSTPSAPSQRSALQEKPLEISPPGWRGHSSETRATKPAPRMLTGDWRDAFASAPPSRHRREFLQLRRKPQRWRVGFDEQSVRGRAA